MLIVIEIDSWGCCLVGLGQIWSAFGLDLGGVWVVDLGLVVVIFFDGLGDLFRWV